MPVCDSVKVRKAPIVRVKSGSSPSSQMRSTELSRMARLKVLPAKRIARRLATRLFAGHGSTRSQPIEAGTTIDRREPECRACGGSRAQPAPEAVFLQAGDVLGLLPRAGIWVVVGCHFTILRAGGLEAPNRAWAPKPYRRL